MKDILYISLVLLLLVVIYQDLKWRAVNLIIFPTLLVCTFGVFMGEYYNWHSLLMNVLFITVIILALFVYISIKQKKLTNIFKAHFGLGDVLFMYAVLPLFSSRNLILFIICGMLFSLLLHVVINFKAIGKDAELTIPLAGYLSIFLIGIGIYNYMTKANIFYQDLI